MSLPTPPQDRPDDEGRPVSTVIRERIRASGRRFHANDNIADFIRPGELDALLDGTHFLKEALQ